MEIAIVNSRPSLASGLMINFVANNESWCAKRRILWSCSVWTMIPSSHIRSANSAFQVLNGDNVTLVKQKRLRATHFLVCVACDICKWGSDILTACKQHIDCSEVSDLFYRISASYFNRWHHHQRSPFLNIFIGWRCKNFSVKSEKGAEKWQSDFWIVQKSFRKGRRLVIKARIKRFSTHTVCSVLFCHTIYFIL